MSARQRKQRLRMIECCRTPTRCVVALRTIVAEISRYVIWICSTVEIRHMAIIACRGDILILIIDMATVACHCLMGAGQGERCVVVAER
jgi:hypothetical protein